MIGLLNVYYVAELGYGYFVTTVEVSQNKRIPLLECPPWPQVTAIHARSIVTRSQPHQALYEEICFPNAGKHHLLCHLQW